MNRALFLAAPIACFAFFAPLQADAARCKSGQVFRPSAGACVSKASAIRAGVYRPQYAKASTRHRYKRQAPRRSSRVELARLPRAQAVAPRPIARPLPIDPAAIERPRLVEPRPVWLEAVDLFDNLHAQAWSAQAAARATQFDGGR